MADLNGHVPPAADGEPIRLEGKMQVGLMQKLGFGTHNARTSIPLREQWEIDPATRLNMEARDKLRWPATMTPRQYQVEDAMWLVNNKFESGKSGGYARHWPGLGKTLLGTLASTGKTLVSCPGYLVEQWADFILEQYPEDTVAFTNPMMPRDKRQWVLLCGADWIIVNHDMFATVKGKGPVTYDTVTGKALPQQTIERSYDWPADRVTVIIDEAHYFRNRDASRTKGVYRYLHTNEASSVERIIELGATPQYKDVTDWYMQLRLLDPLHWKSYLNFEQNYALTTSNGWGTQVYGVKNQSYLERELKTYVKGRTYADVGMQLPELIEKVIKIPFPAEMRKLYEQARDGYRVHGIPLESAAEVMHTLRTFTAVPEKTDVIRQIIEDTPGDEPIIIFGWYRFTCEELTNDLNKHPELGGADYISGDLAPNDRIALAKDTKNRIKVATLSSLSEGVDLSASRTVIFIEEDYTPGKMYQALSRVRRHSTTGKVDPVLVYYVQVRNSIDEAVHRAVTNRQSSVMQILREAIK